MKILKKHISLFLGILFAVSASMSSFAKKSKKEIEPFEYEINASEKTATLRKIKTTDLIEELPQTIKGYPISEVADEALIVKIIRDSKMRGKLDYYGTYALALLLAPLTLGISLMATDNLRMAPSTEFKPICANVKNVYLPECTKIGSKTFRGCPLENVILPKTTTIGASAFEGCSKLKTAEIPNIESISENLFRNCKSLENIVSLPNVKNCGQCAFEHCESLKSISMPNVESIQPNAFLYCTKLETAEILNCKEIGKDAFYCCYALKNLNLPNLVKIHESFEGTFKNCVNLQDIYMPNCESIGEHAFCECKSLKKLDLPKVNYLGEFACVGCENLEEIYLPNCQHIDNGALHNCYNLKKVTIPKSCKLGKEAFPYDNLAEGKLQIIRLE